MPRACGASSASDECGSTRWIIGAVGLLGRPPEAGDDGAECVHQRNCSYGKFMSSRFLMSRRPLSFAIARRGVA
jgi:hypothetical protein